MIVSQYSLSIADPRNYSDLNREGAKLALKQVSSENSYKIDGERKLTGRGQEEAANILIALCKRIAS